MIEPRNKFLHAFIRLVEEPVRGFLEAKRTPDVLHHDIIRFIVLCASLALIILCGFLFSVTNNLLFLFVILALGLLIYRCLDNTFSTSGASSSQGRLHQKPEQDPAHIGTEEHDT